MLYLQKIAERVNELYYFTYIIREFANSQWENERLEEVMPFVPLSKHINHLADNLYCEFINEGYF